MRKITFFIIFLSSTALFAQNPNTSIIVFHSGGYAETMDIKQKPPETKGSFYFNKNWYNGTIKLFSGEEIRNYPLKYDMKYNQINIKAKNDIKIISIGAVKEIDWTDDKGIEQKLINCAVYTKNNSNVLGFFQILSEGKILLLKKTNLKLLNANYNGTVVAGNKDNKYIKEYKYFVYKNNKIIKIRKRRKNILKTFNNQANKIEKFVKQNNLSYKKEYDLIKIFNFYNSTF